MIVTVLQLLALEKKILMKRLGMEKLSAVLLGPESLIDSWVVDHLWSHLCTAKFTKQIPCTPLQRVKEAT